MSASQSAVRSRAEAVKVFTHVRLANFVYIVLRCTWWLSHSLYVNRW